MKSANKSVMTPAPFRPSPRSRLRKRRCFQQLFTLHDNRAPPPRARNRIVKAVAACVRRPRRLGRQERYDAIKFPVLRLLYGHHSGHYVVDAEMMPAHTDAARQHRSNFSLRETRHAGRSGLRKGGVHRPPLDRTTGLIFPRDRRTAQQRTQFCRRRW